MSEYRDRVVRIWTAEEDAWLHGQFIVQGWSAAQCAGPLDRSRNSVIGRVHRMGWTRDGLTRPTVAKPYPQREAKIARRGEKPNYAPRNRQAPVRPGWRYNGPSTPTFVETDDMARTDGYRICDDEFTGCKWPIGGEGADMRFCCLPSEGQTYCQGHAKRAVSGAQPTPKHDTKMANYLASKAA